MSIASNEVQAELLKQGDTDYYGKTEEWIKDKDIYISIFEKSGSVYASNNLLTAESTHIGLTDEQGIDKKNNRIKVSAKIYSIEYIISARKQVLFLKAVE